MTTTIDLSGHIVLVTGGTKGVGRGVARRLEMYGATIVVCARRPADDLPAGWAFRSVDLRDGDASWAMIDEIVATFGRLDCVVNNAGGAPPADTTSASPRFTERIIALNLLSAIFVSQRANHHMQSQNGGGSIVNIGSVCADRASPTAAAYGAAKAGLANFTKTAAMEWAPAVRVNGVTLGLVQTDLEHGHYGDADGLARVAATIPMGRLAKPDEVGDTCAWLASSLSSYVSGANIEMHGGGEPPPFIAAASGT